MPVLMMMLSCPMDEPMIAGPMSLAIRFTASCCKFHFGKRTTFSLSSEGTRIASCTMPPTKTPTASATTGCSK